MKVVPARVLFINPAADSVKANIPIAVSVVDPVADSVVKFVTSN